MAELEPGHPDELVKTLTNWLRQAHAAEGTLLPVGIDPVEWAVRRFIESWRRPAKAAIESIEASLHRAMTLCDSGESFAEIKEELDTARQTLGESLRGELGLYDWNEE